MTQRNDSAVSPVIGVILMVAITVVLAATVWVWISGFGHGNPQPGSIGVSQGAYVMGQDACGMTNATFCIRYTVLSVTPNLDLRVKVASDAGTWELECSPRTLAAGDTLTCTGIGTPPTSGAHVNFIDHNANAVILSVTLHA